MDGTMFDSEAIDRDIWQDAIAGRGLAVDHEFYRSLIGLREYEADAAIVARYGRDIDIQSLRAETVARWAEVMARGLPTKSGLFELLDAIDRAGLPKAVATSTVRARADERLGPLRDRFTVTVCGDEVAAAKPAPDLYLQAAAQLELPAYECVAIEDSPIGMTAAERAGMYVIVVPDLIDAPSHARHVCASLHDVAAWLMDRTHP
jgi:HAD superfamily hydrolase (TIGR01509 family)